MDVVTKHYGPRAANILAVMSLLANLFIALMFFAAGWIPGVWGESFVDGSETVINTALDQTFRGTWYILLGSSVAFVVSAILNNTLNWLIGKAFGRAAPDRADASGVGDRVSDHQKMLAGSDSHGCPFVLKF